MFAPGPGDAVGRSTTSSVGSLRDTRTDPRIQVLDFILEYCAFLDSQHFTAILMNGNCSSMETYGSSVIAILQYDCGKKAGGSKVVVIRRSDVLFQLVSTLSSGGDYRRLNMKGTWATQSRHVKVGDVQDSSKSSGNSISTAFESTYLPLCWN